MGSTSTTVKKEKKAHRRRSEGNNLHPELTTGAKTASTDAAVVCVDEAAAQEDSARQAMRELMYHHFRLQSRPVRKEEKQRKEQWAELNAGLIERYVVKDLNTSALYSALAVPMALASSRTSDTRVVPQESKDQAPFAYRRIPSYDDHFNDDADPTDFEQDNAMEDRDIQGSGVTLKPPPPASVEANYNPEQAGVFSGDEDL
jgi:hypothetical protein